MLFQRNTRPPHYCCHCSSDRVHEIWSFPTPSTASNWHHLTSGYLQLSKNISKKFISHVITNFKLSQENGCKRAWIILKPWVQKTCWPLAALYPTRGRLCGKIKYTNTVHILSYILLCCILMPCLGVNIQPQLSEYPSCIEEMLHYLMFIF